MTLPILICECGVRFKVRGATPGKVGRCPNCGATLRVPDRAGPEESEAGRNRASEPTEMGYGLMPEEAAVKSGPDRARSPRDAAARPTYAKAPPSAPMADGFLPVLSRPETTWFSSLLYPLRGAEPLGVIAMTSATLWLFGVLVPEYCLGLINDATSMGATSIGHFVALISMLPVIMLFPLALSYWLQYLGRVLVSSAMGETSPPRVPDRNFDGFFNGLSPWLIWLCLGVFAGLMPLLAYAWSLNAWGDGSPYLAGALGLLGASVHHDGADDVVSARRRVRRVALGGDRRHLPAGRLVWFALPFSRRDARGRRSELWPGADLPASQLFLALRPRLPRVLDHRAVDYDRADANPGTLLLPTQRRPQVAYQTSTVGGCLETLI